MLDKNHNNSTDAPSGFGDSKLTSLNTLFHEGNVWVSEEQFISSGRHFSIKDIRSAKVIKGATFTLDSIGVFLAGFAILPFQLYVGLAVLAATAYFWMSRKPYYVLVLDLKDKELKILKSTDGKYLTRIYEAIVQALEVKRHSR